MSLINVQNLTFAYEGSFNYVFENVGFQIDTDWKLGFVGRNGKGKTTFLKLLLGEYEYSGKISADVEFTYFPFSVKEGDQSVSEVLREICPYAEDWEIIREFSYLQMRADVLYEPFGILSSGEKTKALLAGLFLKDNSFLLIDEPTNHLDINARECVAEYLESKKGYILVSHDRRFLDLCVDHILSVNKTDIEVTGGNFSVWFDNFCKRQAFETAQNRKLQKDIDRLSLSASCTADWAGKTEASKFGCGPVDRGFIGHKAAKVMKRAKAAENRQRRAAEQKSLLLRNAETAEDLKINPLRHHSQRLIDCCAANIYYGQKKVCGPISFQLEQGDRLALYGSNGCGKSSLLKILTGEQIAYEGRITLASGMKVSYLPQTSEGLHGNISQYVKDKAIDIDTFRTVLSKMGFGRYDFADGTDLSALSQGQKKKIMIAASLCERAHLYVWDEPLNYLDIYSRIQVENLIMQFKPTMIFVEHDRAFAEKVATGALNF